MYVERGIELLKKFTETIQDFADIEQDIKLDGANLTLALTPKKSKPTTSKKKETAVVNKEQSQQPTKIDNNNSVAAVETNINDTQTKKIENTNEQ